MKTVRHPNIPPPLPPVFEPIILAVKTSVMFCFLLFACRYLTFRIVLRTLRDYRRKSPADYLMQITTHLFMAYGKRSENLFKGAVANLFSRPPAQTWVMDPDFGAFVDGRVVLTCMLKYKSSVSVSPLQVVVNWKDVRSTPSILGAQSVLCMV